MYHEFRVGQSIISAFGVCTIIDHLEGNTWGYEVQHRDGRIAWLSAEEMTPLTISAGDMILARHHNGSDHIGLVTHVGEDITALFAIGSYTVTVENIHWIFAAEIAQAA